MTNTGNTTLTNAVITDPKLGTLTGGPIGPLAPGATSSAITGSYTITQADIDAGVVSNTATVTAKDPDNADVTDVSGTANGNDDPTVTSTGTAAATIALVKTASVGGTGNVGDVITYTFEMTNTGNTTLTNAVVTDVKLDSLTGSPIESLAPGASSSVTTGYYTITQADIDVGGVSNQATVTAKDPANVDVIDLSGTENDNDDTTETSLPLIQLADFTATLEIDSLVFLTGGAATDFVVTIAEINGGSSDGQIVFNIIKPSAFDITFETNTVSSNVNGPTLVANADWQLLDTGSSIQGTLLTTSSIGPNEFSSIGFSIERKASIPAETVQPITVTIVNGSGSDITNNNNTYHVNVKAQ